MRWFYSCVTSLVLCGAACSEAYEPGPGPGPEPGPGPAPRETPAAPGPSEGAKPQPPLQVVAEGEDLPWSVAVDERYVYWTTNTTLRRAPLAGGAATTLATGRSLRRVAAADGDVFFTDALGGKVYRVDREGGAAEVIGSGEYPNGLLVRGRDVYWTNGSMSVDGGSLARVRLGDKSSSILAERLAQPSGIAADDRFVYFTSTSKSCGSSGCSGGGVGKIPLAGGNVEVVDSEGTPTDIVMGKRGLYWIGSPPKVMFLSSAATRAQPLADVLGDDPGPLAIDDDALYFSSQGRGRVVKVGLDGGKPQALVTDLGSVGGLAVDRNWVYVAASSQGRILRVAKDGSAAKPSGAITGPCPTPLGTAAEIAATPREEPNFEMLALHLDPGRVTASDETYARVVADLAAIYALAPERAGIGYFARSDGKSLMLSPNELTMESIRVNAYSAWDCLNDFYGLEKLEVGSTYVVLTLKGTYELAELSKLYSALPGIPNAQSNISGGDNSTICARRSGTDIEYVVDRAGGDCPAGCTTHDARAFLSTAPGVVVSQGSWNSETAGDPPEWFTRVCRR